jgi:hypothetical protein
LQAAPPRNTYCPKHGGRIELIASMGPMGWPEFPKRNLARSEATADREPRPSSKA